MKTKELSSFYRFELDCMMVCGLMGIVGAVVVLFACVVAIVALFLQSLEVNAFMIEMFKCGGRFIFVGYAFAIVLSFILNSIQFLISKRK